MFKIRAFILIIWLIFWLYWFASAANTKANKYSGGRGFIGLRLGIIAVVIVLVHLYHPGAEAWPNHIGVNNLPLEVIGAAIVCLGLLFAIWARTQLGRNWGMPMSQKEEPELVTSGPYRYVRHPIYTGIIFASLGTAIAVGAVWLILFIVFASYFIFSAFQEEKYLQKQFGQTYLKYKGRSKMLIPFIL